MRLREFPSQKRPNDFLFGARHLNVYQSIYNIGRHGYN